MDHRRRTDLPQRRQPPPSRRAGLRRPGSAQRFGIVILPIGVCFEFRISDLAGQGLLLVLDEALQFAPESILDGNAFSFALFSFSIGALAGDEDFVEALCAAR